MEDRKLFIVCLGGRANGCNTELHDIVFAVGKDDDITKLYPTFIKKWFGSTERLHLDSHFEVKYVDGFEIRLSEEKPDDIDSQPKLYFINFGAYDTNKLGEVHENKLYVAKNKADAKAQAKKDLCLGLFQAHCDDSLNVQDLIIEDKEDQEDDGVDDILEVSEVDGYWIHLIPTDKTQQFKTICGYRKIDAQKILKAL